MDPRVKPAGDGRACSDRPRLVMAGVDPAIHLLRKTSHEERWTRGSSPRVTGELVAIALASSWPGLTRPSICFAKLLTKKMDPRVKPAGDGRAYSDRPRLVVAGLDPAIHLLRKTSHEEDGPAGQARG